jgi:hypothetical protein
LHTLSIFAFLGSTSSRRSQPGRQKSFVGGAD